MRPRPGAKGHVPACGFVAAANCLPLTVDVANPWHHTAVAPTLRADGPNSPYRSSLMRPGRRGGLRAARAASAARAAQVDACRAPDPMHCVAGRARPEFAKRGPKGKDRQRRVPGNREMRFSPLDQSSARWRRQARCRLDKRRTTCGVPRWARLRPDEEVSHARVEPQHARAGGPVTPPGRPGGFPTASFSGDAIMCNSLD